MTIANGPALPMMRELAIVHIAMHDAANAVDRHYETYSRIARDRRADPALAAAAAAHDVLVALTPARVVEIDAMFQTDLARVTDADSATARSWSARPPPTRSSRAAPTTARTRG